MSDFDFVPLALLAGFILLFALVAATVAAEEKDIQSDAAKDDPLNDTAEFPSPPKEFL